MKSNLLLLLLVCAASTVWAAAEVPVADQRLRLVFDTCISPEVVERDWASGEPHSEAPAALELVGPEGKVLDRLVLAAPLAKLDPEPLRGAPHPTYLVSADLTTEAGSYNGPLTLPVQIVDGHLVPAAAQAAKQGTEPVRLALTGKAAWQRIVEHGAENLLSVSCQPRNGGFVTTYRRYFPSGGTWKVRERVREGLWESDGDFPGRKLFP